MCGLGVLFSYSSSAPCVSRRALAEISERLASRGPDGEGAWLDAAERVGLAHRRLAIQDLDPRSDQPFASACGRFRMVYNGELYNPAELRARLESAGVRLRTTSDTELLLELFVLEGPGALEQLRGMYAFAVFDARERRLFAARDPYGIKPLYWRDEGGQLGLASQLQALAPEGEIEPAALAGFLLTGSVPEPFTWRAGVRALPPGGHLIADAEGVRVFGRGRAIAAALGAAAQAPKSLEPAALQERASAAFADSVARHLNVSDVPVACFLSAGIDSSAILALASEASEVPVETLTLAFEEYRGRADDEAPIAARTAAHYGARHSLHTLTADAFRAELPRLLAAMDQPSIDGINTWFVSKATAERGFKVALSGLGGDELLGGYANFRDVPRLARVAGPLSRVPGLARFGGPLLARGGRHPKLAGVLSHAGSFAGAYLLKRGLFLPHELPALIGTERARIGLERLDWFGAANGLLAEVPNCAVARVAALEASLYMRNQLLRDSDWASMCQGLELRVPLVDVELLRQVAPLVVGRPHAPGKLSLARAPRRPLPAELLERPKTGFTVPTAAWLQSGDELDGWRRFPSLLDERTPPARRLACGVLERFGAFDLAHDEVAA